MAAQFNVPASPELKVHKLRGFRGVDFASSPSQVDSSRSPDAQNIISDLAGKPVKRTGYKTLAQFSGRLNGIFRLATEGEEKFLVHAGTKLYEWQRTGGNFASSGVEIYADMNDDRSVSFQNDKKLYILDGKTYLCYGEHEEGVFSVKKVTEIATVPLCIAGRNPDGTSGTQISDVNVLTTRRRYSFLGKASTTTYKLEPKGIELDDGEVICKVMNSTGEMVATTAFSVDRTKGEVTFTTAPGTPVITGVDNVEIEFSAPTDYGPELINKCRIATQYGYGGSTDRVFVAGNPDAINFHYWSDINDPTYFPGLNYAYLGQDSSAIMGYSKIGDALVVHKEDNEQDQTTFLVTGSYDTTNGYKFAISGSVAGIGAISRYCFQRLDTEPLFLSRQGVYSIATQYLTAERYAQQRSYYVNPKLINEPDLSEAVAKEYNGYYYLAVNGHVYVADSRQKHYERNAPQSEYQYEWYYLTDIDARVWWEYDGHLYFGDSAGKLKMFKLAVESTASDNAYNDDGKPIRAYWDTPVFSFDTLSRYKTLKGYWIMLSPYVRSSVNAYYRYKGMLRRVKHENVDIFDFNDIDFNRLSFNLDDFPHIVATNTKAKKFMLIQFRIENETLDEGFGFYEMEAIYTVTGKYKG